MKSPFKLVLCLFVLGCTGICVAENNENPPPPGGGPGHGKMMLERMKTDLQLSDDQVAQIKTIMKDQHTELEKIKNDTVLTQDEKREQVHALMEQTKDKINAVLTPDQQAKWAAIREQHKKQWEEHKPSSGNSSQSTPPPAPSN